MKIKVRYKVSENKTVLIVGSNLYDCWWRLIHWNPDYKLTVLWETFQSETKACFVSDSTPSGVLQDDDKPLTSDEEFAAGECEGMAAMMLIDSLTKLEIEPTCRTLS